jgi:hypothetical protein
MSDDDREKYPSELAERFQVRLPAGMRERIKKAAEQSGRSMNAEIIAALETYYPPEPSIEEVLDRVHQAIEMARHAHQMPYRNVLIDALDELSLQLASGIEFDQFRRPHVGPEYRSFDNAVSRLRRWRRAAKHGVETSDFVRELERGMFNRLGGDRVLQLLKWFKEGRVDLVLTNLRLKEVKFADQDAALSALDRHLEKFYRENWGDPADPPPWKDEEF